MPPEQALEKDTSMQMLFVQYSNNTPCMCDFQVIIIVYRDRNYGKYSMFIQIWHLLKIAKYAAIH